eukprot:tig00001065_g6727.t1
MSKDKWREEENYASFSAEADYEDGQWINGEFYGRERKRRAQGGKKDAIYGIFADEVDDEMASRGKKKRGGIIHDSKASSSGASAAAAYKPMKFVSGGVVTHGPDDKKEKEPKRVRFSMDQDDEEDEEDEDAGKPKAGKGRFDDDDDEEEEAGGRPSFGGASGSRGSLGSMASSRSSMDADDSDGFEGGEPEEEPDFRKRLKQRRRRMAAADSDDEEDSGSEEERAARSGGGAAASFASLRRGNVDPQEARRQRAAAAASRASAGSSSGAGGGGEKAEEAEFVPQSFYSSRQMKKPSAAAAAAEGGARGGLGSGGAAAGGDWQEAAPMADFERHTKGIGSKLLAKMGYVPGQGLGARKQGIARPIEVKLRKKNEGLAFSGSEKIEQPELPSARLVAKSEFPEAPAEPDAPPLPKAWKKESAGQARKARRKIYKTAQEILDEESAAIDSGAAAPAPGPAQRQVIVDMRGPQARVVTDLRQLKGQRPGAGQAAGPPSLFPELQHNMRLLVDMAESDLHNVQRRLRGEQDTLVSLKHERDSLEKELAEIERRAERATAVLDILGAALRGAGVATEAAAGEDLEQAGRARKRREEGKGALSVEALAETFERLQSDYAEEYKMYGVGATAVGLARPLLAARVQRWGPLEDAEQPDVLRTVAALQRALCAAADGPPDFSRSGAGGEDAYAALVWECILPRVRAAVSAGWQVRECEGMVSFLERWRGVLPPSATTNVLAQLVLPRLAAEVEAWDPRSDPTPIHAWLFPWLPHMADMLQSLYPTIRHRLSTALAAWHPSDGSAHALLVPWRTVWEGQGMEALLRAAVLPKLALLLRDFPINPFEQYLEPFHWVTAWADLMPVGMLAGLLDAEFFPKWYRVLYGWLAQRPNFEEVTAWYMGWKAQLPAAVAETEAARAWLTRALDLMNDAVSDPDAPPRPELAPPPDPSFVFPGAPVGAGPRRGGAGRPRLEVPAGRPGAEPRASFRDVVERAAAEHDITFLPTGRRSASGKPIFAFGAVHIIVAEDIAYVGRKGDTEWAPASLDALLQQAAPARR